jgi:predicted phage terminase large subunit-like protein
VLNLTLELPRVDTGDFTFRQSDKTSGSVKPLSFRDFIRKVNPGFKFYRHVDILIDLLQRVAEGAIKRLMIFWPPRHGKSELVSRLFSAYFLYRHPDRWVGLTSYGATLAYSFSRNARDNYRRIGCATKGDSSAVEQWETESGGGLWAAGVGGGITGKGFHLGIVDDPVKDAKEALSPTVQRGNSEWYSSTFYTRGEPDNAIIVSNTRWHESDLSGWLLQQESEDEPEHWHIVNLPAIAEDVMQEFPETCTVQPDFRQPGEALCPERYDLRRLAKLAKRVGTYFWNALFQQRPGAVEGSIFKRHWWRFWQPRGQRLPPVRVRMQDGSLADCPVEDLTPPEGHLQSWDMNFKDGASNSFVVGQVWAWRGANRYLLDQVRGHFDLPTTIKEVRSMAHQWPQAHTKLIEDKANGPAVVQSLRNEIGGMIPIPADASKEARAHAVAPMAESGNVYLPHPHIAPWVNELIEELTSFPFAKHDDQVDAMTQALNRLNAPRRRKATSKEY